MPVCVDARVRQRQEKRHLQPGTDRAQGQEVPLFTKMGRRLGHMQPREPQRGSCHPCPLPSLAIPCPPSGPPAWCHPPPSPSLPPPSTPFPTTHYLIIDKNRNKDHTAQSLNLSFGFVSVLAPAFLSLCLCLFFVSHSTIVPQYDALLHQSISQSTWTLTLTW